MLRWISAHRSLVATATSSSVIVALIATVAFVSGGYTAQRLDLGDAAVWVTNEVRQVVGRANTRVHELNTVVDAGSTRLDLVQHGSTVLVVDSGNGSLDIVDPARAEVAQTVPLPPVAPQVFLSDTRAVVSSDGNVWGLPARDLESFDSASEPTLSLGSGSVASMDSNGFFYSFSPATGDLSLVDTSAGDAVTRTENIDAGAPEDVYQLTSVNGRWAVFNETSRHLFVEGRDVDLSDLVGADEEPVLQQAAAAGDRVLLAFQAGLVAVPLTGGEPSELVTGRAGRPAAPVSAGRCSYAAWGDGTAWRSCGENLRGATSELGSVAGDARLEFRQNGNGLLLNDAHGGAAWAVQQDNQLIDNWADLIDSQQNQQRVEDNADDTPPDLEKSQLPPLAVDDEFGARPGRSVILPILLNDSDPNGDVLVITELDKLPAERGKLDLVGNNQQVQLSLPGSASGSVSFGYTISDGRGGTAAATVTVSVRGEDENSPPAQVRTTRATVQTAGRVTSQVLVDWVDPDSDPIYLKSASAAAPDSVSFKPEGTVIFTDAGAGGELKQVGLTVSDGRAEGTGSLTIGVKAAGEVPIVAEPFVVLARAGGEVTVSPLAHVRGGSGPLRLSSVPSRPGVTLTPDFTAGTFRFTSDTVGTHYVDYAVTDGAITATGFVRVDVTSAGDANATPVTVPHTAFIRGTRPALVDVLATDIDPAGGVLLVTGVMNVPASSGLRVEVLEQRILRVTLTKPLDGGSTSFNYRVSNGLAEAEGTVTVVEIPETPRTQAPVAMPDSISVRVGDAIDIPVLDNDEHPDNDPLTLHPTLATPLPPGAGVLFASGNVLRYLAPTKTGNFTAVYQVDAPDGQFASAQVRISVREADPASNNPPVPRTVTARVLAGETVRIPIPLSGIDPDGDSVKLLGQETNPDKGAVTAVGDGSIDYQSGDYSAGTDTFTYSVVDALGARATGMIRVGITPRLDGARNPIAAPDEVVARPGRTISVRVLENDSDPDGGTLSVASVEPTGPEGVATVEGELVAVETPAAEGRYGFIYEIRNSRGGVSSNFLTVIVQEDAPLSRPDAQDTVLSLSDVLDRETVDVDVLAHVFFADGPTRALKLSVLPGHTEAATVTSGDRIRVTVNNRSQIIPFAVSHPDDPKVVSYAFIWVPGTDDALPQLRKGAPKLTVPSESTLTININKYVVAVGGKQVRLTDSSTVRATHSNGAELVAGPGILVFTSAEKYYGPASISFEVTDGATAADPTGRTATIVLPITVTPRDNQPPTFDGAIIDLEPDQTKVIDLSRLTTYPYPDDRPELAYTVLEPLPDGFSTSLSGQELRISADESTPKGSVSAVTIGVRDTINEGRAGRIELRVVGSTRPLAVPASDSAIAQRGQTTVIDVLANDQATNPFPEVPLTVSQVRGLDSGTLPDGISITPSADKSKLSVAVSANALPIDTTLQYEVTDATGDSDRKAWGTVRISVQDKPDPVTTVRVTGFDDRSLSVAFNAGPSNNSPISGYEITLLDAGSGAPVSTVTCEATACDVATPGNGQQHRLRVSVAARNGIGLSSAAALSTPVWSDVVPGAPTGLSAAPLDSGLRLKWKTVAPAGGGTPVRYYVVTVGGQTLSEVSASGQSCTDDSCAIEVGGLANGSDVAFTVSARNEAYPALSTWNTSQGSGRPFGPAVAGTMAADGSDATNTVVVSWSPFDANGDPILGYYVQRLNRSAVPTGAQACTVTSPAPGQVKPPVPGGIVDEQIRVGPGATSATFTRPDADNSTYSFVVWGYNRAGCDATPVATVLLRPTPGTVTGVSGAMQRLNPSGDTSTLDYQVSGVAPRFHHYNIRAAGDTGNGVPFSGQGRPRELLGIPFGTVVRFQVQACAEWGTCGAWSEQFSAPEASVTFEVTGLAYDSLTGTFSWTNGPANGDLGASYRCYALNAPGLVGEATTPNTCVVPASEDGTPPTGTVRLTVTVNGHNHNYDRQSELEENPQ
ncbi:MAG TPA: Ig-like domain-containing protein [Glaciibacter sp.]|nr:Ig-like domain-containing protein [Glaciibacter sp.]